MNSGKMKYIRPSIIVDYKMKQNQRDKYYNFQNKLTNY